MLKRLFSETALYGLSSILSRLLNYALTPLYTSVLLTSEYGILSEFYALAAFLNVVYTYGMETAFFRYASARKADARKVFGQAVTALLSTSALFSGLLIAFSGPVSQALGYPEQQRFVVWFALLIGLDAILVVPFAWLRLQHKALLFVLLRLAGVLLTIGLNVWFLLAAPALLESNLPEWALRLIQLSRPAEELGVGYAFLANLIANACFVPMLAAAWKDYRFTADRKLLSQLLAYGGPLVISGLAYAINEVFDRILLKYWLPENFYPGKTSMDAIGIYAACYKISIFISLAVQAFRYAAEPFFFSTAEDKNSPTLYAKVMHYFVIVLTLMMVSVCANADWLSLVFLRQESYREGLHVLPLLLLANVFLGIYYNLSVWYKITNRTWYGALFGLLGSSATLLANYLLIPQLGYTGSALATVCCYGLMALSCYAVGRKYFPVPYRSIALLHLCIGAAASAWLMNWQVEGVMTAFILKNMLLLLVVIVFLYPERSFLAQAVRNMRRKTK